MISPSYSNIDRWLFDYFEGNLSASQVQALELFILENPELEIDLEAWEAIRIEDDVDNETAIALIQANSIKKIVSIPYKEVFGFAALVSVFLFSLIWTNESDTTHISSINSHKEKSEVVHRNVSNKANSERNTFNPSEREAANYTVKGQTGSSMNGSSIALALQQPILQNQNIVVPEKLVSRLSVIPIITTDELLINSPNVSMHFIESAATLTFGKHGIVPTTKLYSSHSPSVPHIIKRATKAKLSNFERMQLSLKKKYRSIKRMMDYPIALKNSRTPHLYLPEHTLQDINFGFTGASFTPNITLQSRMQWLNYNTSQYVNSINFGSYVYGLRGGIGAQIKNTYYGDGIVKGTETSVTYSPKISLNSKTTLEPSVRFKMGNKHLNLGTELFNQSVEIDRGNAISLLNQEKNPIGNSLWYKDIGIGLLVNSKYFYAGIQVDNVFKHYDDLFATEINNNKRASNQILFTIGTDYENVKKTVRISPSIIYQKQGGLSEMWLGVNYQYKKLMFNGSISNNVEPTIGVGLELKRFSVFYHADYLNSSVNAAQSLSHQFGIKFMGRKSKINKL
jgi:type IX secretion system PorP/SprF family membrane protein